MKHSNSLRGEILLRLLLPLLLFMVLEGILSYFVTLHYVNEAYDRWLLDSAHSLAQEIKTKGGNVFIELPTAAREIFEWDDVDETFFKITSDKHGLMIGDRDLPDFSLERAGAAPLFFDAALREKPLRGVTMQLTLPDADETIALTVAETVIKRRSMMTDILLAVLVPQVGLLLLTGAHLLASINRGLRPLQTMAKEIAQRSPRDLSPIPDSAVYMEIRALTHTINGLLSRLASVMASQQRFIANAAHQLRTPLAGLKLQAERARREDDLAAMRPALAQIQNSADRLSHMVTQLLVLAKSEPLENSYTLLPLDLTELVREVCVEWAPKALASDRELSYEGPNTPVIISGDAVLLRELLINLLDNALAYSRTPGQIRVGLTAPPTPCLSVQDEGPGIPPQEVDKILERFYRIQGSPGNGCGLGLAIVKEIAELHGASLRFTTPPQGHGTIVQVFFTH